MRRAAIIAMLLAPAVARADVGGINGESWLHYELSGLTDIDKTDRGPGIGARQIVLAGARLHGFFGQKSEVVGYHVGFDFALGGTIHGGGFAYDVALMPVGVGVRFGTVGFMAFGTGVQAMGATGTIDDAVALPLDVTLEVGRGWRLLAHGRVSYLAGADGRQSGSPSVPFADELEAMVGLRFGQHYTDWGFPTGNGYFIGGEYREIAGTRFAGIVIGYSIDAGTRRHGDDRGI